MRSINKIILCLTFTLNVKYAISQNPYIKKYDAGDGFLDESVYRILADKFGFLWFCTANGLAKYDGVNFKYFDATNGLPGHGCYYGDVDSKGTIWFISMNRKLFYYRQNRFNVLNTKYNDVTWLFFNEKKDLLFFTTLSGHLVCYRNDQLVSDIKITDQRLYTGICISDDSVLVNSNFTGSYLVTRGQVIHINNSSRSGKFTRFFKIDDAVVSSVDGYLFTFHNGKFIPNDTNNKIALSLGEILDLKKINNLVYFCTKTGLYYSNNVYNISHLHCQYNINNLTSICQDINKHIWLSSYSNGAFLFKNNSTQNFFLKHEPTGLINFAYGDNNNNVYLFYSSGIIKKLYFINEKYRTTTVCNLKSDIKRVNKIDNGFYITTDKYRYYLKGKKVQQVSAYNFLYNEIDTSFVRFKHKKTFIPIHYSDSVIRYYTRKLGNINSNVGVATNTDTFWSGNELGLLLNTKNGIFRPFNNRASNAFVSDMKVDSLGQVWVATKGMGIYTINKNVILPNTLTQKLNCNNIVFDSKNNIWISATEGLYKLANVYGRQTLYSYNIKHLIPKSEVKFVNVIDDKIFVITNEGLNIFYDDTTLVNIQPSTPYLSNVLINNKESDIASSYTLNYNENNIHIEYGVFEYYYHTKPRFFYCMKAESGDSTWLFSDNTSINFSKLSPGKYTFYLIAKNANGYISKEHLSIHFQIRPPFWETTLFYCIYIVVLIGILFGIYFWINHIQKNKRKYIEAELIALREQINPHFIFNSLNGMQKHILSKDISRANEYLANFANLMRNILNNSKQSKISLSQELQLIIDYVKLEQQRFSFEFKISIDSNIIVSELLVPSMVLQPVVENAINHGISAKSQIGIIKLDVLDINNKYFACIIEDNGSGRTDYKSGTGLSNTDNRLKLFNQADTSFIEVIDLTDEYYNAIGTKVILSIKKTYSQKKKYTI